MGRNLVLRWRRNHLRAVRLMRALSLLGTQGGSSGTSLNFQSGTYTEGGASYALTSVPGLNVAGPTIASYVPNASGLTAFGANQPRIVSGEGLFLEPASTNYCCYSLFPSASLPPTSNSYWQTVDGTISYSTAITNPDGSAGCCYFQQSNSSDARVVANKGSTISLGVANGTEITASIYVKASTPADVGKRTKIYIYDGGFSYTSVVLTASWQRVSITFSYVSSYGFFFIPAGAEPGGVDVCNMYLWGANIEIGSNPTSLISTLGSAVTRSADIAKYSYSNSPSAASLLTAANDYSLPLGSPIDFGGDSGGAWLNGFTQKVMVG